MTVEKCAARPFVLVALATTTLTELGGAVVVVVAAALWSLPFDLTVVVVVEAAWEPAVVVVVEAPA
jgi:hypothetical protein